MSAAPSVLLSQWLSLLHPGVCVCLYSCHLLRVGDPSWGHTKREVSDKCIKIKGTDKECVVASSDGVQHNLGPLAEARTHPLKAFCFVPVETKNLHQRDSSLLMKAVVLSDHAEHLSSAVF